MASKKKKKSLETIVLNQEMKSECGKGEPVGELCMGGVRWQSSKDERVRRPSGVLSAHLLRAWVLDHQQQQLGTCHPTPDLCNQKLEVGPCHLCSNTHSR